MADSLEELIQKLAEADRALAAHSKGQIDAVVADGQSFLLRAAQEALRESEIRFRTLIENISDAIALCDPAGAFLYASPGAQRMFGYDPESEFVGHGIEEFIHPADRDALRHNFAAATRQPGASVEVRARVRHKDGSWRHVAGVFTNRLDDPAMRAVVCNCRDITEVEQAQRELNRVFDLSPDVICTAGFDGFFKRLNPAFERMLGYTREEMLARPFHEFVHPDDVEPTRQITAGLTLGTNTYAFENRYRAKDGSYRWIQWNSVADVAEQLIYAVARDVSEQRAAEEKLLRSQRSLALAQRVTGMGSWEMEVAAGADWQGAPVHLSDEMARLCGLIPGPAPAAARDILHLIPAADRERVIAAVDKVLVSRTSYRLDHGVILPDGTRRVLHEEVIAVPGEHHPGTLRIVGTAHDVTQHRRAEERLREQAELLDLAHDAIMVRDLDARILYWNCGAQRVYGWTAGEAVGRSAEQMLYADAKSFHAAKSQMLATGEWSGELRQVRRDGAELIVDSRWTLGRNEAGEPKSVLVINRDITAHRQLEEQFFRAQRLESIGTLASGVAHDLNNILAPILMAVPILRMDPLPAETKEKLLSTMETSAQRGAEIVRQVLTFARGSEGERLLVQPAHLVKEIAKIAQETFPKTIEVRTRYTDQGWPVMGDPTHLHQLLLNLCVNARDAMPSGGGLVISVENEIIDEHFAAMMQGAKTGPHVVLQVTDTGTGIPPAIVDKIFDPFFTTKEQGKGTGLGLSTVVGIVKGHGGWLNVYSEPGHGTTFKVFLPVATEQAAAGAANPEVAAPPLGRGELVLVVDDEPGIVEVTRTLLERSGYRVLTAADGTEALAIFARQMDEVDAVLTDIMMPFMDGITLTRALRKMKPQLGIIASTGRNEEQRLWELESLGVTDCLTKPYNTRKLLTALRDTLEGLSLGIPAGIPK